MRLTNYIRDAFIEAAMQDVPVKCNHSEEIRKLAFADVFSRLPKDIQKIWKENGEARSFLIERHDSIADTSFAYPSTDKYSNGKRSISAEAKAKIDALKAEMDADSRIRKDLRDKLKGAAYSCTTTKQLRDLLPEFDQYLPAEEEQTCRTLPAVANLVADFTKAGWPKKAKAAK